MNVETVNLPAAAFWPSHLDRWLAVRGRQSRSSPEHPETCADREMAYALSQQPAWPRVFPGL
jgi:hypothetical protein